MPQRYWLARIVDFNGAMGARVVNDLITWQLADEFRREVHRLVLSSPDASRDFRYRSQLLEAASSVPANISEGFARRSPLDFARFLDYALGSLAEAESRLTDGQLREYFTVAECEAALVLKRRCTVAGRRLRAAQFDEARRPPRT